MALNFLLGAASLWARSKANKAASQAAAANAEAAKAQARAAKLQAYGQALNLRARAEAEEFNLKVSQKNRQLAGMAMEDVRHATRVAVANRQFEGRKITADMLVQLSSQGGMTFGGSGARIMQDQRAQQQEDVYEMINNMNKNLHDRHVDIWSRMQNEELMRMSIRNDKVNAALAEASGVTIDQVAAQTAASARAAGKAQKWGGMIDMFNAYDHYFNRIH